MRPIIKKILSFSHLRLYIITVLVVAMSLPAYAGSTPMPQNPPIDTSTMPDSVKNLIQDVLGLIDSMSIKTDSSKMEIQVDSSSWRHDTIVVSTSFVRDSIIANELMHILDSVSGRSESTALAVADSIAGSTVVVEPITYTLAIDTTLQLTMDSLALAILDDFGQGVKDTTITGVPVNIIFMPVIFDGQRPEKRPPLCTRKSDNPYLPHRIPRRRTSIEREREFATIGDYAQAKMIVDNPELVRYTPEILPKAIHMDRVKKRRELLEINTHGMPSLREVQGRKVKLKRWISNVQSSLQVSQTYISDNWYQGGTSNVNLISNQIYTLKYKDYKGKILFENSVQWKLNIGSAPDDTVRNYNISEDVFRIDSKFGYQAFKRFYYSASIYFKTQLFNNYTRNTHDRVSSFLSPGEFSINLGLTHNYTSKNSTFSSSLSLSPLSYNIKTCIDHKVDETRFGIEDGKRALHKVGSSCDANLRWVPWRNIEFKSRLYYFTSYERVQIDWENSLNFILNRYFSTRIEFKMRYDDSVKPNDKGSFIQMKELLSFGLNFRI